MSTMTCGEVFFESISVLLRLGTLGAACVAGYCAFRTWVATKAEHDHFCQRAQNERLVNSPQFKIFNPSTGYESMSVDGQNVPKGQIVGSRDFAATTATGIGAIFDREEGKSPKVRQYLILEIKSSQNRLDEFEVEVISEPEGSDFEFGSVSMTLDGLGGMSSDYWAASYMADPTDKNAGEIEFRLQFITRGGWYDYASYRIRMNHMEIERTDPRQIGIKK